MKLKKGVFKMCHNFRYSDDTDFKTKVAVINEELSTIKHEGYDGIVTNAAFADGYLKNSENMMLLEETVRICDKIGLRVWIYDEKYYPSGAAGTMTLENCPDSEAKALASVYRVLKPQESAVIPLPHGHLEAVAAFALFFEDDTVTEEDMQKGYVRIPLSENGFRFENRSEKNMLCLAFFTKNAFDGTHCQHNAAVVRKYVDIGDPAVCDSFIENTYKPYIQLLKKYLKSGRIESFFFDEPSFMGVYFNLKKQPRQVAHLADPDVPLWAMVNWSKDLPKKFEKMFGYSLIDNLPRLFVGCDEKDKSVRCDFYSLLSSVAGENFFKPLADFCTENDTKSAGHLLLEERITDHPKFAGNFFTLLKNQHIPGMDMLDSLPERVRAKAFTPLLVSSVSRMYAEGNVIDEVSPHFQIKFGVKLDNLQIFNALVMQYCLGANIFCSYYDFYISSHPLVDLTETGETVLAAFKRTIDYVEQDKAPLAVIHYPIEAVNRNTTTPVDVARVFDSALNESLIPYPIDINNMENESPKSLINDSCYREAKEIEKSMENCMNELLDKQISMMFCDTESISRIGSPELFVIPEQEPPVSLIAQIPQLMQKGCTVVVLTGNGKYADYYKNLKDEVVLLNNTRELDKFLVNREIGFTKGETKGVVALSDGKKTLFVNSDNAPKTITVQAITNAVTDCFTLKSVDFEISEGKSVFTLAPYGIYLAE